MEQTGPPIDYRKLPFDVYFGHILRETVNTWGYRELTDKCKTLGIQKGSFAVKRGKVKQSYKQLFQRIYARMSAYPTGIKPPANFTYFDYLVVIDFEATCFENAPSTFVPEIIQFPAVLVDARLQVIVDEFSVYVKPKINPKLSAFCTQLTGITQKQVSEAPEFPEAWSLFEDWLASHKLGTFNHFAIVCDGSFDMGKFLYTQCEISKIPYFNDAYYWVNIRKSYQYFYNISWISLRVVLDVLGLSFQGRPHNGLDDSRNIAGVLIRLMHDGCIIIQNEQIVLDKGDQARNAMFQNHLKIPYCLSTVQSLSRKAFMINYNFNSNKIRQDIRLARQAVGIQANKENNMISVLPASQRSRPSSKKRSSRSKPKCVEQTSCSEALETALGTVTQEE